MQFSTALNFSEMKKLNSDNNHRLLENKRLKKPNTQYACSNKDTQVVLEVEVIGSIYATMSRENEHPIDQDGIIEVTIIRPGTAEPSIHFPQDTATLETINAHTEQIDLLQYHAKSYQKPAARGIDRRRIPHLTKRKNNNLSAEKPTGNAVETVGEIVGDLPNTGLKSPDYSVKIRHGDHSDSFTSNPEIPCAGIDEQSAAVKLLKTYVINAYNSKNKLRAPPPRINPLAHQLNLGSEAVHENYPLIEFRVAQKILETYEPKKSSQSNNHCEHQIIEAMTKALTEWSSDKEIDVGALYNDTSSLMKCEHCGVISFKKSQISVPIIKDEFSVKVNNVQQLQSGDDGIHLTSLRNVKGFCDSSANTPRSKPSFSFKANNITDGRLNEGDRGIVKIPEKSSQVEFHNSHRELNHKLSFMSAERESDSISENVNSMINVGSQKDLKAELTTITMNRFGSCLSMENEKKSIANNTLSNKFSAKTVQMQVPDICRGNGNRNNFGTVNNKTKNLIPLSKFCAKTRTMYKTENTASAKSENSPSENSSQKRDLVTSLESSSNISTKLERSNTVKSLSSNGVTLNHLTRKNPATFIYGNQQRFFKNGENPFLRQKGCRSLVPTKSNDSKWHRNTDLRTWNNKKLSRKDIEKYSLNHCTYSMNLAKNLSRRCISSSDDQLSTDQKYAENKTLSDNDHDRRSLFSPKTDHKNNQIDPYVNYSAPLIGFPRNICGTEADNIASAQYNEESETTDFSSSSSENVIRESMDSLSQVPRFGCESISVKSDDVIRTMKAQINKTIGKYSNYTAAISKKKLHCCKTFEKLNDSLQLDQEYIASESDDISEQSERFKNTNCGGQSEILQLQENSDTSESIFTKRSVLKAFDGSLRDSVKITCRNPTSVISSSSECSDKYQEVNVLQGYMSTGKSRSLSKLDTSETLERQITYEENSNNDISRGIKENVEVKALPLYRKILESKDEMDWESFQQLVETLHPSQRELWYDICKAVSNEVKRVAGKTGGSTEVHIEIIPIPNSNASFSRKERNGGAKISSNEISFEMDMAMTDSDTFFGQISHGSPEIRYESEKCH